MQSTEHGQKRRRNKARIITNNNTIITVYFCRTSFMFAPPLLNGFSVLLESFQLIEKCSPATNRTQCPSILWLIQMRFCTAVSRTIPIKLQQRPSNDPGWSVGGSVGPQIIMLPLMELLPEFDPILVAPQLKPLFQLAYPQLTHSSWLLYICKEGLIEGVVTDCCVIRSMATL